MTSIPMNPYTNVHYYNLLQKCVNESSPPSLEVRIMIGTANQNTRMGDVTIVLLTCELGWIGHLHLTYVWLSIFFIIIL